MFSRAISAARPAATRALRSTSTPSNLRAFSVTCRASSGGHGPPPPGLFGPGGKAGEVPGIAEQSTGLERLQYLGDAEGIEIFDTSPLDSSRIGTKKDPILVASPVSLSSYPPSFPAEILFFFFSLKNVSSAAPALQLTLMMFFGSL